ncbi:MAG TPA: response regulator [Syntrophales bacterium]|nr:response regulator [Syntrophales bacterium]
MPSDGARVLVIDDEKQIRRMLNISLTATGYNVAEASTGHDGLNQAAIFHPDVIILDLGLPDCDGKDIISKLREWTQIPIIILSVREKENEKIGALDAGADDYITKPFSMGELLARIRVALRHSAKAEDEPVLAFGEITMDIARRIVTIRGKELRLTPTEYEILKYLALQADRVITHRQLLRAIWGPNYQDHTHYLRIYIAQLRHKIEADPSQPRYILTEPGVGYRLVKDSSDVQGNS